MFPGKWIAESGVELKPSAHESFTPKLTVESVDNHVFFYSNVDSDRGLALIRTLREIDVRLRNESLSRGMGIVNGESRTPIWLHIQSPGGGVFAAFAIADQLKMIPSPIYSIVEGFSASAATVISMSCTKRFILPSAFMLIHQVSSLAWGRYDEIKDEAHLLDMLMDRLTSFYCEKSKMRRDVVEKMLARDSWFKASECLKLGLADSILGKEV